MTSSRLRKAVPLNSLRPLSATAAIFVLLAALLSGSAHAQRRSKTVKLTVGQTRDVCVPGTITRVQVLNPQVADVADHDARCVRVVAVGPGSTEIIIRTARGDRRYSAVVTRIEIGQLFRQVRKFIGDIEKVNVQVIGDLVVVEGAALTPEDYGKVQRAVEIFGDKVLNLVAFDPRAVGQVNQILRRSGLKDVEARLVGGTVGNLFLEGSVGSKTEMEKVRAILRAYGLKAENLIKVGGGRQILIDVYFVEMSSTGEQELGILWPAKAGVTAGERSTRLSPFLHPAGPPP
jgi:Flp pilus assembly secretin CpaC